MNNSTPIDSDPATTTGSESVGLDLRRAREAQSKSREDAAQEINLRLDQLDALEHDQFNRLPGDAFVRGYLRTYARWLNVDQDQVLADYIKQTGASESVSLSSELHTRQSANIGSDNSKILSAAIVVGLFIFGFWLYNANRESVAEPAIVGNETTVDTFSGQPLENRNLDDAIAGGQNALRDGAAEDEVNSDSNEPASLSSSEPQAAWENPFISAANDSSVLADGATQQVGREIGSDVDGEADGEVDTGREQLSQVQAGQAAAQSIQQQESAASTATSASSSATNTAARGSGPDELLFRMSEDCWLEVKNNEGQVLLSALGKAGETRRLNGTAPYHVLLGNAPGVQLSFNGKEVEVRSRNSRNSARVTLRKDR